MPLIRCDTCGKSFESDLKKNEHCPLCDGWAGEEIATDAHPGKKVVRNPPTPRQPPDHSDWGGNLRAILMVLIPIGVFIGGIWQGKGCDAAWSDAKLAIIAILTHTRPDSIPPNQFDPSKFDLKHSVLTPLPPRFSLADSLPDRDTVFGLGDHVHASADLSFDNGVRVPAASTGIIASVGDQVSDQQRYWVAWVHPDIPNVTYVNERDLLPDGLTGADCAEQANWRSAQFRLPGAKYSAHRAFVWCRRAALLGRADAMCDLGWMYSQGIGISKDEAAAVPWYRRSAELGNVTAMNNLGIVFRDGCGIAQDDSEAVQ
jgi:hypothetical protein